MYPELLNSLKKNASFSHSSSVRFTKDRMCGWLEIVFTDAFSCRDAWVRVTCKSEPSCIIEWRTHNVPRLRFTRAGEESVKWKSSKIADHDALRPSICLDATLKAPRIAQRNLRNVLYLCTRVTPDINVTYLPISHWVFSRFMKVGTTNSIFDTAMEFSLRFTRVW